MARPSLILATILLLTMYYSQVGSQAAAEYLFVVGGGPSVFADESKATEIVSLTEDEGIPECLSELADHPNPILFAAGGALPAAGTGQKYLLLKLPTLMNSARHDHTNVMKS